MSQKDLENCSVVLRGDFKMGEMMGGLAFVFGVYVVAVLVVHGAERGYRFLKDKLERK